jgi:hypothetical protein
MTATEKRVAVFARNSDPVRNNPEAVAHTLRDGAFPSPFRGSPIESLDEVGVVSLWTRDPSNLRRNAELSSALEYCQSRSILVELQVSVTGFGGRFPFLEFDVPTPETVAERLGEIIAVRLVPPELMRVRIDPVLAVAVTDAKGSTWTVSNMRLELIDHLLGLFGPLGIRRYVFSHRDVGNYDPSKKRIRERFTRLGLDVIDESLAELVAFFGSVRELCERRGLEFGLCANPPHAALPYQACIDNAHYMANAPGLRLRRDRSRNATRPCCRCFKNALSVDRLGGTACYPNGRGCLFCYSQGERLGKAEHKFREALDAFRGAPERMAGDWPEPYRAMVALVGGRA